MNRNLWNALSQDVVQIENIKRFIKSVDKLMDNRLRRQWLAGVFQSTWKELVQMFGLMFLDMPIRRRHKSVGEIRGRASDWVSKEAAKLWESCIYWATQTPKEKLPVTSRTLMYTEPLWRVGLPRVPTIWLLLSEE